MSRHNTGNALGSDSPLDLQDNAKNFDLAINATSADEFKDRFGVSRDTWAGLQRKARLQIQAALDAKILAEQARDDAVAAAASTGVTDYADTHAGMVAAGFPDGSVVMVFADETRSGATTIYQIESGAPVFKVNTDRLRMDLLEKTGAALVGFERDSADGNPGTVADAILKTSSDAIASNGCVIEQFVSGFFGRGMLDAEAINVTTETVTTAASPKGSVQIAVASSDNIAAGGCITLLDADGRYRTHVVLTKADDGKTIYIAPAIQTGVAAGAPLERTWYNKAHPGKFYIRGLAQRVAHDRAASAAVPNGKDRVLYCAANAGGGDGLSPVGGAEINRYAASSVAESPTAPVRFAFDTAYVTVSEVGHGVETEYADITCGGELQAVVGLMFLKDAAVFEIQAVNETGSVVSTLPIDANTRGVAHEYRFSINPGTSSRIKIKIVCTAAPSGAISFFFADVLSASPFSGKIIEKRSAKIVCVGDSWIAGDLSNTPNREPLTAQLKIELPYAEIINSGVGGDTVTRVLARFDTDVAAHAPDYVVVNVGTNDAYNPASTVFDPNAIDYFVKACAELQTKIQNIGAKCIFIGCPALAESDGLATDWLLNTRSRAYAKARRDRAGSVIKGGVIKIATSGETHDVAGVDVLELNYTTAAAITNFTGAVAGQMLSVVNTGAAPITFRQGVLQLSKSADVCLRQNGSLTLLRRNPAVTGAWIETGRSLGSSQIVLSTVGDATPSVAGVSNITLDYPSAQQISDLLGGTFLQSVTILSLNGNASIKNGAIVLQGGVDLALTALSTITVQNLAPDGSPRTWVEVSRSVK